MLKRGYQLVLEPDRFEGHLKLAELLDSRGGWERVEPVEPTVEPEAPPDSHEEGQQVLPHQQAVIDQLKRNQHGAAT